MLSGFKYRLFYPTTLRWTKIAKKSVFERTEVKMKGHNH